MTPTVLDIFDKVTVSEEYARTLENFEIKSCNVKPAEGAVALYLSAGETGGFLPGEDTKAFGESVKNTYGLKAFDIYVNYPCLASLGEDSGEEFSEYFARLMEAFVGEHEAGRAFLSEAKGEYKDGVLTIDGLKGTEEMLRNMGFDKFMADHAAYGLGREVKISLKFQDTDLGEYIKKQEEIEKQMARKASVSTAPKKTEAKPAAKQFGKPLEEEPVPIINLNDETGSCVIRGEVIDRDVRENTKGGRKTLALRFSVGDDEWATACTAFGAEDKIAPLADMVREGELLKLGGSYEYDDFLHSWALKVTGAEALEKPPVRPDNAPKKRVELHLHTKMSALDAVTKIEDLVDRAAYWGHPAMAITDHGVVQGFPAASAAADAHEGFKMIYGMEGYLIDDIPSRELNKIRRMKGGTYVVFDLETTGLEPESDEITEIGAVKIRDGLITDSFSQLVNPGRPIPRDVTDLTGITDDMVKDMPEIEEVFPKFKAFCGDAVMVAHNASFDMSFVYEAARRLGTYFPNKTMDTLEMSRNLFPREKVHKLDFVCERLGVSLGNHHRAVDDSTATAYCFIKMMEMTDWKEAAALEKDIPILAKDDPRIKDRRYHIILLARNYVGLKNLYKLVSRSNLDYFYRRPGIPKSLLFKYREGIVIGSACEQGELYRGIIRGIPDEELMEIAEFYDYLEIQPLGNNAFMVRDGTVKDENELIEINKKIVDIGDKTGRPTVATCDVHFMDSKDEMYRRVLQSTQGFENAETQAPLYFRTTEEMLEEFSYLGDRTEEIVIDNTLKIADTIEDIKPVRSGSYPPEIPNSERDLLDMCHRRAREIYGDELPELVKNRMDRELGCIVKYGYSVMYIIAQKLVKKSNDAGYLVGSRGSVGSSFAAYLAGITEVNALPPHYVCPECKYSEFYTHAEYAVGPDMPDKNCPKCGAPLRKDGLNIPFETFLGFEGDKVPDIDLNFSGEYQATAHKYVGELFGEDHVFKAGTIGTIAEKTAIALARKYYDEKGIDAPEAELKRISKGMVKVKRTTGQHPGGIIVCPKNMDIHDFTPVQHPAEKNGTDIITTHFDFNSIHDNLLKLDILGHDDPSTIRMLEDLTGVDALKIPFDDPDTLSIFSGTEALGITPKQIDSKVGTFGVPEFGTKFVREMLVDTMPKTFVELLIISGLSHGTDVWLNNARDLIRNKTATLTEVISLRDDIMVYLIQKGLEPAMAFQIMEFVRRGRAAKEGMPKEYEKAMREHDVPDWYIESCKKIKYMFPKAHAAAYVMMAVRIAYFKVHYPIQFYISYYTVRADVFDAAIMTKGKDTVLSEMRRIRLKGNGASANEEKLFTILEVCLEMYERGIEFAPVNLYESHAYEFQEKEGKIVPPLNSFQGVGTAAAQSIYDEARNGEFMSKDDLKQRAGVNKTVIEVLEENGVLDSLPDSSQISF